MKIVEPSAEIISFTPNLISIIAFATRLCYKSESKGESDEEFVGRILHVKKHESVIEHGAISVHFVVDRGISHELVRHRLCAFSQESTRYCNYSKDKFGSEITVVNPPFFKDESSCERWLTAMEMSEENYLNLMANGSSPQQARSVLPNSLKTELVLTTNPREWRHIFKMRTPSNAHSQMQQVMRPLLAEFQKQWPVLFKDITYE